MRYFLLVLLISFLGCENPVAPMPDKQGLEFGCPPNQYWDYDLQICVDKPYDIPEELL